MHGDFGRAKITVGFKVTFNIVADLALRLLQLFFSSSKQNPVSGDLCKQSDQAGHSEVQTLCPGPSCFLHSPS